MMRHNVSDFAKRTAATAIAAAMLCGAAAVNVRTNDIGITAGALHSAHAILWRV